jgi:hypothetical protein
VHSGIGDLASLKKGGRQVGSLNKSTIERRALVAACVTTDEEDFLRTIMTSDSPLVTLRDRIDCAKALLTSRCFAKEEKPDPKLVESAPAKPAKTGWDKADELRLAELRRKKTEQIEKWNDAAPWHFDLDSQAELRELEQRAEEDAERKALGL